MAREREGRVGREEGMIGANVDMFLEGIPGAWGSGGGLDGGNDVPKML